MRDAPAAFTYKPGERELDPMEKSIPNTLFA